MEILRQLFVSSGFSNVETFIASGNVIFQSSEVNTAALEEQIAVSLNKALGFEVATFIRTDAALARIPEDLPFSPGRLKAAAALNVAFVHKPLDDELVQRLMIRKTDIDTFAVQGREVYWLCLKKQSESKFSNAALEKTLGKPTTMRGINTIKKMVAKYELTR